MFTVVITGGIASGKTVISSLFQHLGAEVIDTDIIAREVVEPGQPALNEIARTFGENILLEDGRLNRGKLREIVFDDPVAKAKLEGILHPTIAFEVQRRITSVNSRYCIIVIPLFAESSGYKWVDRVLVVDVPESVQLDRVQKRDGISREQAELILKAQASREERLALADDVIENTGSLDNLKAQVQQLHQKYLRLAEESKKKNRG